MKTGYSILLGEFVNATSLAHRDCEPFQIVCPACREPLFKVERATHAEKIDYLSHYQKTSSYVADCELRVASSASEQGKHNQDSRNQKLTYFLAVFSKALESDPYVTYSKGLENSHSLINRSKAWRFFREQCFSAAREMAVEANFREYAEFYISEAFGKSGFPVTGFSVETQVRIACDMMKLLSTAPARPNYDKLFNHAAIHLIQRMSNPSETAAAADVKVMNNVLRFIGVLIQSGERAGMDALREMAATPIYPPFVERPSNYILKVASEIGHEIIGTLLRLPYFEILKARK